MIALIIWIVIIAALGTFCARSYGEISSALSGKSNEYVKMREDTKKTKIQYRKGLAESISDIGSIGVEI